MSTPIATAASSVNKELAMEVDQDQSGDYFTSYENLEIHEIMLRDKARNEAYRRAIMENRQNFEVRARCQLKIYWQFHDPLHSISGQTSS